MIRKILFNTFLIPCFFSVNAQEIKILPLDSLSKFKSEIELLREFQIFKRDLEKLNDSNDYNESCKLVKSGAKKFPIKYLCQVPGEVLEGLIFAGKHKKVKTFIKQYIQVTLWEKHVAQDLLFNEKTKSHNAFQESVDYFHSIYYKAFSSVLKKQPELIDKIVWIQAINQRDQDFRRYVTFTSDLSQKKSVEGMNYFDSLNIISIKAYVNSYGYPNFAKGTYKVNLSLLHYNQKHLFTVEDFNYFNAMIWSEVVNGAISLSDYCYFTDRYMVLNLGQSEYFGSYSMTQSHDSVELNRIKIGLLK